MTSAQPRVSASDLAIFAVLGAVWGGSFLFMRVAAPQVGPLWAAEARIGIAALVLLALFGRRAWPTFRAHPVAFLVVGVTFSAIPFSLIAYGSLTLPAGIGALLNAATPISTALVSALWIGQRITGRAVIGMFVGIVAVAVLVGWSPLPAGPETILAVAAVLGATVSYAVGGTTIRRHLHGVSGLEVATGQLVIGALALLPVAAIGGPPGVPSADGLAALIAVALVSTALAWPLYFRVLSHTTPMAASTVTFVVPAFGMLWGALALGEPIGIGLVTGFGLVCVSLVLVLALPIPSPAGALRRFAHRQGAAASIRPTPA
jgi:drug/metabolite transporter (DMT)-like permease